MLYQHRKKSQNWQMPSDTPVDMVITWANMTDPVWQESYKKYVRKNPDWKRHLQCDELELSLASVTKYMPWLRTIYLITECNVPLYVKRNPKVRVVHSNEILGPDALTPTFNSNVIESYMHRLPGLSECFLWGNDDFFVGQYISKSEWFKNGIPLVTFQRRWLNYPIRNFEWSIYNATKLAASFNGEKAPPKPSLLAHEGWGGPVKSQTHQISILRKSGCQKVWDLFPEFLRQMGKCRTRKPDHYQIQFHLLAALVAIHWGSMTFVLKNGVENDPGFYDEGSSIPFKKHLLKLLNTPPRFYCINQIKPPEHRIFTEFKEKMLYKIEGGNEKSTHLA